MRYVIAGGGIAGTTAAEELRRLSPDAEITLVSEEHHPIYSRVLLPHYVKGNVPRERCFLKKETWYAEKNIEWLPGIFVTALDVKNRFVALSDGRELPYDKLLLATGGEVNMVLDEPRGISYFRTLDDADHMLQLIRELPAGATAAVYGGGFIACEYINVFKHFEIPMTVIHRGPHFWSKVLDAESGALIAQKLAEGGCKVISDAVVKAVEGETEVASVATNQGSVPCNVVGVGIGITPNLSWIKTAGVEVGHGVRTNEYLETNVPDVYAAGDGAEYFDATVGRHRMAGTWQNAMSQGRAAARAMAGERAAFRLVSSYATNVLGLEIIFIGDVDRLAADRVASDGSAAAGGVAQRFFRGGKLVGATLVNRNAERAEITKEIAG